MEKCALEIRKVVVGPYEENCYVLVCPDTKESVIVDPGADPHKILVAAEDSSVKMIVITHGHSDHVGALITVWAALKVPIGYHPDDAPLVPAPSDIKLTDGETVTFGNLLLQVIHTPGHTPGSICLFREGDLIAGDTIFPGGPGRTDTPGSFERLIDSLRDKVFVLPENTVVHPGHGASTTIGAELPQFKQFLSRPKPSNLCGDVTWSAVS